MTGSQRFFTCSKNPGLECMKLRYSSTSKATTRGGAGSLLESFTFDKNTICSTHFNQNEFFVSKGLHLKKVFESLIFLGGGGVSPKVRQTT